MRFILEQANRRFQELYEQLHDKMLRVAYRMVGNIDTAEDLVQNAFLLALFRKEEFMKHPLPEGWLMRVLQNLAMNERRRIQRYPETPLDSLLYVAAEAPVTPLEDVFPQKLPEQDRNILIWRFEESMDYAEIAERLGISEVGCRSRVFRAVKRCRELLEQT